MRNRSLLALVPCILALCVPAARAQEAAPACGASVTAAHDLLPDGRPVAQAFDSLVALARVDTAGLVFVPYDSIPRPLNARAVIGRFQRQFNREGTRLEVILAAWVGTGGRVAAAEVLRSSDSHAFDRQAITALRQLRFRPAHADGCPVPFFWSLPITVTVQPAPPVRQPEGRP